MLVFKKKRNLKQYLWHVGLSKVICLECKLTWIRKYSFWHIQTNTHSSTVVNCYILLGRHYQHIGDDEVIIYYEKWQHSHCSLLCWEWRKNAFYIREHILRYNVKKATSSINNLLYLICFNEATSKQTVRKLLIYQSNATTEVNSKDSVACLPKRRHTELHYCLLFTLKSLFFILGAVLEGRWKITKSLTRQCSSNRNRDLSYTNQECKLRVLQRDVQFFTSFPLLCIRIKLELTGIILAPYSSYPSLICLLNWERKIVWRVSWCQS
jgi:hypothetical protein